MRVAQVSPFYESVPPKLYGGTERIVSYLTEALVELGHEVTLFASGDSRTGAHLMPVTKTGLRLQHLHVRDPISHHLRMLETVFAKRSEFDVLHFHLDYLHLPFVKRCFEKSVTTMHGRLDLPDLASLLVHYAELPFVSVSNAQRQPLNWLNWAATVYHGIPKRQYRFHEKPGSYLAFLGRISPEKRLDRAISIAKKTGIPLRVAAKVDPADQKYFAAKIKPLLRNPLIEFLGEIGEDEKDPFLGEALALLFPIDWPEPFGLVMIESLAAGTPVIAYPNGSVPEVIKNGTTGFLVRSIAEAVRAVGRIHLLDRRNCRADFEERFTAERMARDYLEIYRQLSPNGKGDDKYLKLSNRQPQ